LTSANYALGYKFWQ